MHSMSGVSEYDEYEELESGLKNKRLNVMDKMNLVLEHGKEHADEPYLSIDTRGIGRKTTNPIDPVLRLSAVNVTNHSSTSMKSPEDYCIRSTNSRNSAVSYQQSLEPHSHVPLEFQYCSPVEAFINRRKVIEQAKKDTEFSTVLQKFDKIRLEKIKKMKTKRNKDEYPNLNVRGATLEDYIRYKNEARVNFKAEQINNRYKSEIENMDTNTLFPSTAKKIRILPNTSKLVDNFVVNGVGLLTKHNTLSSMPGNSQAIDSKLVEFVEKFIEQNSILHNGDLSVIVNTVKYPPEPTSRGKGQLLRPVIVDGCAMSSCYNSNFKPLWGVSTINFAWTTDKILSMKPIVEIALLFLIRGHKITVILPEYYMEPLYQGSIARCKVDDLEVFQMLRNLNLIMFIEPNHEKNFMDRIREEVDKVDGLLISSQDFDRQLESKLRYEQRCLETTELKIVANESECEPVMEYKLPEALTKPGLRMLTPSFIGRSKVLVIMFDFHVKDTRGKWFVVPEQENLEYNIFRDKGSQIDDIGRMCQQLFFSDQSRLLSTLKDMYELSKVNLRSVQAILRLGYLSGIGKEHCASNELARNDSVESDVELVFDLPESI